MRKKVVVIVFMVVIVFVMVMIGIWTMQPKLKDFEVKLEYGEKFEADKLLTEENQNMVIDESSLIFLEGKDYPEVGNYELNASMKTMFWENKSTVHVIVQDSTPPKFTKTKKSFSLTVGDKAFQFENYFEAEDLSKTTLKFDTSKVDVHKAGTYTGKVIALDASHNEAEIEFTVTVKEKVKPVAPPKEEVKPSNSPTYVRGIMIVNKKYPVSSTYAPGENGTAASKARELIHDMRELGLDISTSYSGYRSYEYQRGLYNHYVANYGQKEADTFSARPGYSEHQTGLAFDLLHQNGQLVTGAAESEWIAQNAHRYGFIVRYQEGKEKITGYQAEPWHIRYVGSEAANIYQSGLTLEEYLGVQGGDYVK